jgi:hypothetical protein
MRRKNTISPEKPQQDSIEYRFKQLLLPNISYALSVTILGGFIFGIFAALNTKSIAEAIVTLIGFSLLLLIAEPLGVWFALRDLDIVINAKNISAVDYWYRRKCIGWKEITLIKQSQLLGIRYLSIKTADGRSIQIASHFYNSSELLDRVRELAGEDHILVRALEKELSRPRYELTKVWCWVIGSIALTMSIYLIGGNMYAAEQEKPLEQAIASYVRQHPKTAPNQSAIDLQSLMAKLGQSVEVFGDGSEVKVKPDKKAIAEWKELQDMLAKYLLKELKKIEGSIEPPPDKIASYLKTHQAYIEAIETHLINNPIPEWGSDSGWVEKSDPKAGDSPLQSKSMAYIPLGTIHNLIVVNTLYKQLSKVDISSNLAAIEKIQQSFQSQPSLLGQLISRIGEDRILNLARRLDKVPTGWGENLFSRDRRTQMISAIENESMSNTRMFQSSSLLDRILIDFKNPLRFVPGYSQLARPRIRLAALDRHREVEKGLAYWSDLNICRTDGKSNIKLTPGLEDYNYLSPTTPLDLTNQYPKLLRKDLSWELTTSVRQVKAKLAAGEKLDRVAKEFNLPSQVCPGENWTAKAKDGAVSIEFSHPPDWKALGVKPDRIEPLTYKIKPVDRPNL